MDTISICVPYATCTQLASSGLYFDVSSLVEIRDAGIHGSESHLGTAVIAYMRILRRNRWIYNSFRPHSAVSAFITRIVKFKRLKFRPDLRHSLLLVHDHSLRDSVTVHDSG